MSQGRGRSFGANILISFAFTGLMTGLAFGNSIIVARMVGTEGRGLYALAVAVLGIGIPLANLGLSFSSTWALGQGRSLAEVSSLNHLWNALLLVFGAGVAGAGVWWFDGLPEAEWPLVIIACALTLPASVYLENTRGVLLGMNQVVRYNVVAASSTAVLLVANLLLLGWGPEAVLLTLGIAYWLPAVLVLIAHAPHMLSAVWPRREFVDENVRYGVKATGSHLIEVLLLRLDYLLVTPIVGIAAVGLFSVADQIATVLAWGGLIAGRMMLAQSAADRTGDQSRRKLGLGVRTLLLVVALGALGIAATGWWVIPVVFGAEFAPAVPGMLIMLPAALIRGANALISSHLIGRNVIRPVLVAGGVSVAAMLVLAPAAALAVGWLGVAAVRVLVVAVQLAINVRAYRRHEGEAMRWIFDRDDFNALRNWVRARLQRRAGGPSEPE